MNMNDLRFQAAQRIEEAAYVDMVEAAPAAYAQANGLRTARVAGAACFACKGLPVSLFNRVLRLGTEQAATESDLDGISDWMREHAAAKYNVSLDPNAQPASLAESLRARSLRPSGGGIARFWRNASTPAAPVDSPYVVQRVGAESQAEFGQAVQDAFGFPPGFAEWIGALAGRRHWHTYIAHDGRTPVGVGAMYVGQGTAWLGIGGTIAAHRRGGVQNLLLARRIDDAIALGVDDIHVETGHPAPGDTAGPSYRNILRAGFELLFVREEFAHAS
jgi:hypothetical protein